MRLILKSPDRMSNPKPVQTPEFVQQQFQAYGELDVPLSKKVTGVKLPLDVHEALQKLAAPERVTYLRKIITDAVRRDLIG